MVYAFLHRHRQVFARYPKLNNKWRFKSVECGVHFRQLMKSGILSQKKLELLWCSVMLRCLYIIRFLTCPTSLSGIQWCH